MNGFVVCRRLKSVWGFRKKPAVIMCSQKSERFDLYWALKQGADAYLDKPFRPNELIETAKYLLRDGKKAIAPSTPSPSSSKSAMMATYLN